MVSNATTAIPRHCPNHIPEAEGSLVDNLKGLVVRGLDPMFSLPQLYIG
jgi:hypothetical protein